MHDPGFDYDTHLAAVAQGDVTSFRALYDREAAHMSALAGSVLGCPDLARHLIRDVFILVWKHADSHDPSAAPARTWLYSILRHRIKLMLRQQPERPGRVPARTDALPAMAGQTDGHSTGLHEAIHALQARQRALLLGAYYHGHDYSRLAAQFNTDSAALAQELRAALRKLQALCPA